MTKASEVINSPTPKNPKNNKLIMPFINGKKLSEHLDSFTLTKQKQICKKIGQAVAKIHNANIIHGDLTTSNIILKNNKIFFIDFGLGFISHKIEDKAVDIHLFKQTIESKHFKNYKKLFKSFLEEYNPKEFKKILERLKAVEKRGRYKS